MKDLFSEIWASIRRNKLRTCLTGFAVAWGILMIIVLLGAGNGLMNAFMKDADKISTNTMTIYRGSTSIPFDGLKSGREIRFNEKDIDLTSEGFPGIIDEVATTVNVPGTQKIRTERLSVQVNLMGVEPEYQDAENVRILAGRFIDKQDLVEKRKVIVISSTDLPRLSLAADNLQTLIGESIIIGNFAYTIVGVHKGWEGGWYQDAYIPYSTAKSIYPGDNQIDNILFSFHGLESMEDNEEFEAQYRTAINKNHHADPNDRNTIYIDNRFTQNLQMNKATSILTKALWIIGLLTLISGIVGVSNIMLITVKERTHEFGIRKAIGARPWDVIKLIISESIVITAFFGYVGMVIGLGVCEYMDFKLGHSALDMIGEQMQVFVNPRVGIDVALEVTVLLIAAGTIAGLIPSVKAAKVKPIEALRAE